MTPKSSLARHVASNTASEELDSMRLRAWRYQGVVVLKPEEIIDPWVRQVLINEAVKRYGPRPGARR
ncbi:MAG: hypothetical protein AB7I59_03240 [Geminicoccaceae bacterium]